MSAGRRRYWGWHQLTPEWACRLVAEADIRPNDLVLDVGAGRGALTAPLVDQGAHVIAVELHPARVRHLRARFAGRDVTVVCADAADLRLPRRPFRVVANPPFGATMAVLRRLTSAGSRLASADLVVPRHVGMRWADGGAPGAGRWRRSFDAAVVRTVPRSAFTPSPPRDAVVLRLRRR